MLTARAYSFRQKSKLAISLSWIGGYANVALFLTCASFVSHMTGNSTQFALGITQRNWAHVAQFGLMILCFWLGAVASAFMTESAKRRGVRSKYILPMAAEGMVLATLAALINYQTAIGLRGDANLAHALALVAAFAMGLQNATITEISGAVIRTTHLTGVVTDFGLEGVRFLNWYVDQTRGRRAWRRHRRTLRVSQRHPTAQRLMLLFSVFWSFIFGAAAGAWMHFNYVGLAMLPPVVFILWIILMDWRKPIAGVKELDLLSDPELKAAGIVKALLPPELGLFRLTPPHRGARAHHPPDFQLWLQHAPEHWRVIILALSPWTHFNENSALGLREVAEQLRGQDRELIISGITSGQYKVLAQNGLMDVLDAENFCPDLEFAIARGIELVRHQNSSSSRAFASMLSPALASV
jgi:uncharacterized membrane protein YoaK (UPF0700 family)